MDSHANLAGSICILGGINETAFPDLSEAMCDDNNNRRNNAGSEQIISNQNKGEQLHPEHNTSRRRKEFFVVFSSPFIFQLAQLKMAQQRPLPRSSPSLFSLPLIPAEQGRDVKEAAGWGWISWPAGNTRQQHSQPGERPDQSLFQKEISHILTFKIGDLALIYKNKNLTNKYQFLEVIAWVPILWFEWWWRGIPGLSL